MKTELVEKHQVMLSSSTLRRRCIPRRVFVIALLLIPACRDGADETAAQPASTQPQRVRREALKGPVQVVVEADRDSVEIPRSVSLELTVRSELGVDVQMPEFEELLGPFEVKGVEKSEPVQDDMHETRCWTIQLAPLLPGSHEIPPLAIAYRDARPRADGSPASDADSVETPSLPVSVRQELADVKGPAIIDIARSYRVLLWIAAVAVAMGAAALLARWWRRRRGIAGEVVAKQRIPPHVWALKELDRLVAENLIGRGQVQEFYFRINALLRRYIELRFGIMAGEQTSEEFLRDLQRSPRLSISHKEVLQRFVTACDPVKYARYMPQRDEIDWVQSAARDTILQTAETPEDPASPAAIIDQEVRV